ncbi:hypothetical protein ATANTOWER_020827 [Ataeniobius toweri]|uniref:Uncharacterized protein n=1 Tax=Ataeniobius toweri TaxID=208326 RepID=A0ABU7BIR4_9TELE|nr:hypothetical protein [Ataeniobius toweri]
MNSRDIDAFFCYSVKHSCDPFVRPSVHPSVHCAILLHPGRVVVGLVVISSSQHLGAPWLDYQAMQDNAETLRTDNRPHIHLLLMGAYGLLFKNGLTLQKVLVTFKEPKLL